MKIALFLLLCSLCVVRCDWEDLWEREKKWKSDERALDLSSESEESKENLSSEESDEEKILEKAESSNEEVEDDISRCAELCVFQSQTEQPADRDLCTKGCKLQTQAFRSIQERFGKTLPELLLGTAVDKCWDGCAMQHLSPSPSPCVSGCDTMRKIQRKQLTQTAGEAYSRALVPANDVGNNKMEIEHKPAENENDITQELADTQGGPVQWTYVLWRPELSLREDPQQSYARMVNMMTSLLLDSFSGGEETNERQNQGWSDDRMQLRIPSLPDSRPASLRTGEEEDFYNSVAQSLKGIKEKVGATISAPGFRQDMYYVLIGLCTLLLLTAAFNSIFRRREDRGRDEDHYFLHGAALTAKLPSYEDCIKADRDLMVEVRAEEITKTPAVCQDDSAAGREAAEIEEKVQETATLTENVV